MPSDLETLIECFARACLEVFGEERIEGIVLHGSVQLAVTSPPYNIGKSYETRLPCYLETDKTEDVTFYEKHGFSVVEKVTIKDSPPFWAMRRPARA